MQECSNAAPTDLGQHVNTSWLAGVLEDKSLLKQTPGSFRTVLAGKVSGLLRLGSALAAAPLRALALFSSVSSLVAPVGQLNYATANAMLNHWASQHSAQGESCSPVLGSDSRCYCCTERHDMLLSRPELARPAVSLIPQC